MTFTARQLANEKRYWQGLLATHRCVKVAAAIAGVARASVYPFLTRCGLVEFDLATIGPPDPPLAADELVMTRAQFHQMHERAYWLGLMKQHKTVTQMCIEADVCRTSVYKRFAALGIGPEELRKISGRKAYGGNDAWRSLGAPARPRTQPKARRYRLPLSGIRARSTSGAQSHG